MADIALALVGGQLDATVVDDDVGGDDGLETAVLLSLFLDRRAEDGDELPSNDGDRRGWWGDQFLDAGDRVGSRAWLLDRAKSRPEVARDLKAFHEEALAWLIEDKVTDRVDVETEIVGEVLFESIIIQRPGAEPATFRFRHVWEGEFLRWGA